jgi:hypothetical protein
MTKPSIYDPSIYQSIRHRIDSLTVEHARKWGKMELPQMMAHLRKSLETGINTDTKNLVIGTLFGPIIKKIVFNEKPYKQSLPTAKNMVITDDRNFEEEKAKLLSTYDLFYTNGGDYAAKIKHPLFGKMNAGEWGFSQWKHIEHHLRQFGV